MTRPTKPATNPALRPAARLLGIAVPLLVVGWADTALAETGGPVMLVHGNYCGLGSNAPLPPVDALDAACARHDACTPDDGLPAKACHVRLEREAQTLAADPRQPDHVRMMASFVAAFAATATSTPGSATPRPGTAAVAGPMPVRARTLAPRRATWTILR